jgi:hypothetical protein
MKNCSGSGNILSAKRDLLFLLLTITVRAYNNDSVGELGEVKDECPFL